MLLKLIILTLIVKSCISRVLFFEDFNDNSYKQRWTKSIHNIDTQGKFELGSSFFGGMHEDQGLKTYDDYRYYLLSRKMKRKYNNRNKTLVVQLQVTMNSLMECGGGYIKIMGYDFEPKTFTSKTPYKIMFGPDICGFEMKYRDVKVILSYRGRYYRLNQIIRFQVGHYPQLYTLILRPDNTYEIFINMTLMSKGHIGRDFRMIRPKMIRDPKSYPPPNWDCREYIMNMSIPRPYKHLSHAMRVVNPEHYNNRSIPPDIIINPNYMRPWHPPLVRNPAYRGRWLAPYILNPNYNINDDFYLKSDLGGVGIDVWQMSAGVVFDNILITDNEKYALKFAKDSWRTPIQNIQKMETNRRPHNASEDNAHNSNDDQDKHFEFTDDTGQPACFNLIESTKNTIFGPTQDQDKQMSKERQKKFMEMIDDMHGQISLLPPYPFSDRRYFNPISQSDEIPSLGLVHRLEILEKRRMSVPMKFIMQNELSHLLT